MQKRLCFVLMPFGKMQGAAVSPPFSADCELVEGFLTSSVS
jgi:hypothetical protein